MLCEDFPSNVCLSFLTLIVSPTEQGFSVLVDISLPVLSFTDLLVVVSPFFLNFMLGCVYVHMYMCCEVYVTTFM